MLILQSARFLRHGWCWSFAAKDPCKMPWTGTAACLPWSSSVFFAMIATVAAVSYYLVAHAIKGVQFSTPRQSVHLAVMKSSLMSLLV